MFLSCVLYVPACHVRVLISECKKHPISKTCPVVSRACPGCVPVFCTQKENSGTSNLEHSQPRKSWPTGNGIYGRPTTKTKSTPNLWSRTVLHRWLSVGLDIVGPWSADGRHQFQSHTPKWHPKIAIYFLFLHILTLQKFWPLITLQTILNAQTNIQAQIWSMRTYVISQTNSAM